MQDSVLEHGCMLRMEFGKAAASIFVTYLKRGLITSKKRLKLKSAKR
jgi:hypothetical protein